MEIREQFVYRQLLKAPLGLVTSLKGKKTDVVRMSFRIRESPGGTEGLGPVNLQYDDFGRCITAICSATVPCAYGIRSDSFSDALNLGWILALLFLWTRLGTVVPFCSKCSLHPEEHLEEGRLAAKLPSCQKLPCIWFSSPDSSFELNVSNLESLKDNEHRVLWKISCHISK